MFASYKLPELQTVTVSGASVSFNSVYAGLPLKRCVVTFDEAQPISSLTITANGDSHTFALGESLTEGELNVLTGVLTRSDTSTKQLEVFQIETVKGQNTISCDKGDTEVQYIKVR